MLWCVLFAVGLAAAPHPRPAVAAPPPPSLPARQAAVIQVERAWLAAQQPTDVAALARILAPDFVHVFASGLVTRAQELAYDRAHPRPADGTRRRFERLRVRVYGDAAIANGVVELTRPDGPHRIMVRRHRFTDVFVWRDGRWQAVNAQKTEIP